MNALLTPLWLAILIPGAAAVLFLLWWRYGPGPRRARKLRHIRQLLQQGHWSDALQQIQRLRKKRRPPRRWQKTFDVLEADCLQAAVSHCLEEKDFDQALDYAQLMAELCRQPEAVARASIQSAMLDELRRLFSEGNSRAVHEFAARPLLNGSAEVVFWQALCYLREGEPERALASLQTSGEGRLARDEAQEARDQRAQDTRPSDADPPLPPRVPARYIDPPLYLGALLLRRGQLKDALRYLTEANRIDSSCPVVTVQLGSALIAAGGDTNLAVRALKRALGPKGLAQWADQPARAWVEAFPEHHSYVRKLAGKYAFLCPVWGGDLQLITRQGKLALAQGLYRLGQFQEAGDLFKQLLDEGAPSALVLRGLGISLAKLSKHDDAFKHLRIAHEMEEPKDRLTAGYLALCGARGKPSAPEAKVQNVEWAVRLVSQYNAPGDPEWVGIISELFAEAREHVIPLSLDDQLYLCEHLGSVHAADMPAAHAYHHLQATYPQSVRPEYAWLFCRAIEQHGPLGSLPASVRDHTLDLFALTYANEVDARAFFTEHQWDFGDLETTYLIRAADLAPGSFPPSLGVDYAPKGEQLLLVRSKEQEKAGQIDKALATIDVLARLAPQSAVALDGLAFLHHRQGHRDQALAVLARWQEQHPNDPLPIIRQAVFIYQAQQLNEAHDKVRQALTHSEGRKKADMAVWAARLVLHQARGLTPEGTANFQPDALNAAHEFLQEGVRACPEHRPALECLAAVRWNLGDLAALAAQAPGMSLGEQASQASARFHFFAALCHWAGGDLQAVPRECQLAVNPSGQGTSAARYAPHSNGDKQKPLEVNLALEASYLAGLAYGKLEDWTMAQTALEPVAQSASSPSASLAQAHLGAACLAREQPEQAVRWWQTLDAKKRTAWQLAEPLGNTMFLSALAAFQEGRFEEAAEKFRTAGKLGSRDRRLGPLLILSLFRAGQKAYYMSVS